MVEIKKRLHIPQVTNIKTLAWIKLFIALANASVMTIWALYINSFVNNSSTTGFISSILTLVAFISFFAFIPLVEKSDKGKLFGYSLILSIIFYATFSIINSFAFFIIAAIALTMVQAIKIMTFGIIIKDTSEKSALAK